MVNIGKYEGYSIVYENEEFSWECKTFKLTKKTEQELKEAIDHELNKSKRSEEERKKYEEEQEMAKRKEKVKITLKRTDFLTFLTKCSHFSEEIPISVTKTKLECSNMDPANVLMFHREIGCKSNFEVEFSVNTSVLKRMLIHFRSKELKLSFKVDGDSKLLVVKGDCGKFECLLPDDSENKHKIPELKFGATFVFDIDDLNREVELVKQISESIVINARGNKVFFSRKENKSNLDRLNPVKEYQSKYYLVDNCGEGCSKYSIEYLGKRFFKKGDSVTINFGLDYPTKITDEKNNWLILAPRVDNNDY